MSTLLEKVIDGSDKKMNLICIPYAGGGASMYFPWKNYIRSDVGLYSVQLPGRENRITDEYYRDIGNAADDITKEVLDLVNRTNRPICLFGHSMGAKIAFEVERRLEKEKKPCTRLMVSGSRAPHMPETRPICGLGDSDFLNELNRFEGTPSEILNNKEMVRFFMPLLRADFTMDEQYILQDKVKLSCPIFAFYGEDDSEADGKDMDKWKLYTDTFGIKQFEGKHFFVKTSMESVIEEVNRQLV